MNTIKQINVKIDTLANAERITKKVLAELSRDILEYIYLPNEDGKVSEDISPINRVLAVLTPMNKATAILFFKNFVSWKFDDVAFLFTKKNKKNFEDKLLAVELFLVNEDSNIWTWAANNVTIEPKAIDWTKRLTKDFAGALEDGLSFDDILAILEAALPVEEPIKEAA